METIVRGLLLSTALLMLAHWNIGVSVNSFSSALLAAFVIGLLNAFVRPLLIVLTLPVTILTLGLFLFVINALTFQRPAACSKAFRCWASGRPCSARCSTACAASSSTPPWSG